MDPSATNSFEDQWRKALREASETPPPSVWEGIEARLDEGNDKGIIPLWGQSPKIWYAAASVVALLLVGVGLWYSGGGINDKKAETNVAFNKSGNDKNAANDVADISKKDSSEVSNNTQNEIEKQPLLAKTETIRENRTKNKVTGSGLSSGKEVSIATENSKNQSGDPVKESLAIKEAPRLPNNSGTDIEKQAPTMIFQSEDNRVAANVVENNAQSGISAELLNSLPYDQLDVHFQKRFVFFRPEIREEEEVIKPAKNKEYWAALGVMPASFNPDVKIKEAPLAFSNQTLSNKKSVSGTSEAGASYSVQTQGGVRVSKHWTVEFGLSYLKGNSDYQGGGYVLSAYNSKSANALENALSGLASAPIAGPTGMDKGAGFANNQSIYIDVTKKVSNNYQYLQLPVQAGFTLNPDKKLSYSVLGGMAANFFLTNDLESASGEIITTKASDEIYRTVNWAATTGLRFNYRLSSKWKASLTGSYQKAVSSGFRSNQSLDSHPYLYGVAWGVRYSF
ncbi:MSCRAMM family adhesin SdrC [Dyadobacter sp. CY323]|uniref:MSCRAMM family adhesin SdrC n=1 Tax=Dyadobacter sp. CY323 TaxID=2907302 RepID=UPI001F1EA1DE|nr:MSCRAMM family adhesin SdrC [Dyadobacter sp. CY323]MCE6990655.1 MSCRAMM family adhesin SdrC [Dyadobacter sp. CY323]